MTPYFESELLPTLRRLNRWWGPVSSLRLAAYLGQSDRTVRWWLHTLEKIGKVERPLGKHSGYKVVIA